MLLSFVEKVIQNKVSTELFCSEIISIDQHRAAVTALRQHIKPGFFGHSNKFGRGEDAVGCFGVDMEVNILFHLYSLRSKIDKTVEINQLNLKKQLPLRGTENMQSKSY